MQGHPELKFQFHKGTIRTLQGKNHTRPSRPFQFHKGTIRTSCGCNRLPEYQDFNSIKVQLEPVFEDFLLSTQVFQFHKGTIRTKVLHQGYLGEGISIP